MDRYQRVEKPRPEIPINENEIRITTQGAIRNYISYATSLLQEKHLKEIVFKAMGQAISKTVAIVEILKRNIPRLHQDTAISSVSLTDIWEPIEEGLLPVETTRQVSMITITLSTNELNKISSGYQAPHNIQQPKQPYYSQQLQPRQARMSYNAINEDSYGRVRGRGKGTGRGWGRGGYGNYQYQDNDGYANGSQGGGRGRDRGYQDNGGYANGGQGGRRGRDWGYQDNGGYANGGQGGGRGRDWGYQDNGGYANGGQGGGRGRDWGYQDNGGYANGGQGGGRGRDWGYQGAGYERGRGGGGRGYGRGRGRMGGRPRGGGYQS